MFNIFNKKVSGRLLGTKALYSVSFTNCTMSWERVPLLEKMARKNYPTLDNLVLSGRGQTKSDVILRIFVSPTSEEMQKSFPVFLEDGSLKTQDVNKTFLPVIAAFRIKAGDYKVVRAEKIAVGTNKKEVLKVTGLTSDGLQSAKLSETVFVLIPSATLVFDLLVMDEDEPKLETIKSDFAKILGSLKTQ